MISRLTQLWASGPRPRRIVRRRDLEVGHLEGRLLLATDLTAPTTTAAVIAGIPGNNGYFKSPIAIQLNATDPDNAPSTLTTYYNIDNGPLTQGNSLSLGDGIHTIRFFSVDPSNNREAVETQVFKIDTTAPVVTAAANPTTLWPPNHKFIPVTVTGHVTDSSGGVPTSVTYRVFDEYGRVQPQGTAAVDANGNYSFVVNLQASRRGQDRDGRQYTILVAAFDQAGNAGSAIAHVTVPHDQGHHHGGGGHGHGHGND